MGHATPPDGRVLGDYAIEREIGRGGMGVVYRARDRRNGKLVALKVLEAHLTLQSASVERFLREAHAAAGLRHDHIVRVDEVGECDGAWFFAMELVEGPSLAEVIAHGGFAKEGGGLDFERVAATLAKVAHALHHAHQRGILHRDVKPSNVLMRSDGCPLLIDFGLVREEGMPALTRTGDLVGSPYYVAPEQTGGGHAPLDRRVDVYSLGVVLYELATLRRPFEGDDARDVLARIAAGDFLAPRQRLAAVPRDLDRIVRRAMATRPGDRYATAAALARDLERFAAGKRILGDAGAWRRATAAFFRERPHALAATAGVALLAAVVTLGRPRHQDAGVAGARSRAQLTLTCDDAGVVVELRPDAPLKGDPVVVALPLQAPLSLAPGRYSLLARAADHDARELAGERALDLAPGAVVEKRLWLPPFERRLDRLLDEKGLALAAGDVDGGGRDEIVVAHADGSIVRLDGAGAERPFAKVSGVPYAVAVAHGACSDAERSAARVVVAVLDGSASRVVALDGRGQAAAPHDLHGRVRALLDLGATQHGSGPLWCAATDVGDVEVVAGTAPAAASDAVRTLRALAKLLCDADGRPRTATARLFLLRAGAGARGDALALVDGDGVRIVGVAAGGALELRTTNALPVRDAAVLESNASDAGDRLVVALDGGRARLLDAEGHVAGEFPCGECDALAVARTCDGPRIVVAGARGLAGFDASGAPRFELALEGRVTELFALDVDGDGDDALFTRLDGRRAQLWSSERDDRVKAGRDVRDFAVVAPDRVVIVEGGDAPCLLASDGRRLASVRLPSAVTVLDVDAGGALRCGGADGRVRELRLPTRDEGDALVVAERASSSTAATTVMAHGALGEDAEPRIVRGDVNGTIFFTRPDGGGEASFTVRERVPVVALATGDVDGVRGDETYAVLDGGTLVGFKTGGAPRRPIELGDDCTALALIDVEGSGTKRDVVVAISGGELRWYDGDGVQRGTLRGHKSTVRSLVPIAAPRSDDGAPLAAAGTARGNLLLLVREGKRARWQEVATPDGPIVAVAVAEAGPRAPGELLVAGLTATRVVVFTSDGTRLADAPASGRHVALADLDGDDVPELIYVDAAGRWTARRLRIAAKGATAPSNR